MNIEPTYISFKQAKLLKEKGFDELVRQHYKQYHTDNSERAERIYSGALYDWNSKKAQEGWNGIVTSAPEQWQVVEWLRVNHGIWIKVDHFMTTESAIDWDFEIDRVDADVNERGDYVPLKSFDPERSFALPQEAYSAAFDYVLTNLI